MEIGINVIGSRHNILTRYRLSTITTILLILEKKLSANKEELVMFEFAVG